MLVVKRDVFSVLFLLVFGLLFTNCKEVEVENYCKCWDTSGILVLDTVYYMENDQAYQLCEGKEGTQNYSSCECGELYH